MKTSLMYLECLEKKKYILWKFPKCVECWYYFTITVNLCRHIHHNHLQSIGWFLSPFGAEIAAFALVIVIDSCYFNFKIVLHSPPNFSSKQCIIIAEQGRIRHHFPDVLAWAKSESEAWLDIGIFKPIQLRFIGHKLLLSQFKKDISQTWNLKKIM